MRDHYTTYTWILITLAVIAILYDPRDNDNDNDKEGFSPYLRQYYRPLLRHYRNGLYDFYNSGSKYVAVKWARFFG